jgi:hypothetical protein
LGFLKGGELWLLSCKWVPDFTSLWKKTVLTRLERDALEPEENLGSEMDISLSNLSKTDPGYLFQIIGYN